MFGSNAEISTRDAEGGTPLYHVRDGISFHIKTVDKLAFNTFINRSKQLCFTDDMTVYGMLSM